MVCPARALFLSHEGFSKLLFIMNIEVLSVEVSCLINPALISKVDFCKTRLVCWMAVSKKKNHQTSSSILVHSLPDASCPLDKSLSIEMRLFSRVTQRRGSTAPKSTLKTKSTFILGHQCMVLPYTDNDFHLKLDYWWIQKEKKKTVDCHNLSQ